MYPSVKNHKTT